MNIYANELSFSIKAFENYNNIVDLVGLYDALKREGLSACYLSYDSYNMVVNALNTDKKNRNILQFVYSFFHPPYEESIQVIEKSEEYSGNDWEYKGKNCFGLAISYILDSLALSLNASEWDKWICISKNKKEVKARNVSTRDHVEYHLDWINSQKNVELVTTDIKWENKKIHLRDDHGKAQLLEFSKRIIKSKYVIEVLNSIEFHPKYRKFILSISENGVIQCVLFWSDCGYGISLQTTGRNMRETKKIAELLEAEYS